MNIAYICSDRGPCPPVKGGAIQLYISKVAPILAKKHAITVFSITDKSLPKKETRDGVTYIRFSPQNFQNDVLKTLRSHSFDIIQVFNRPGLVAKVKQVSPQSKVILSLHNLFFGTKRLTVEEAQDCIQHTDYMVTVSQFVADHATQYGFPKHKVQPVYSGVDLEDFPKRESERWLKWRQDIRRKWRIPGSAKVILFAGRLVPDKGCHVLVESMKSLLQEHSNLYLLVVGSKWYTKHDQTPYIKSLIKEARKLSPYLIFTSYIPVDKINKYYAAADLFVCASQWEEPLARVHYEAMAASLPMISTDRGGNGEVIEERRNGFCLIDYANPEAFSSAIGVLLNNWELARRMGDNGRILAELRYPFERVAHELLTIYHRLLGV